MKKSELKEIIREVVKEELEKLEAAKAAEEVSTEEPTTDTAEEVAEEPAAEESTEESTEDAEVVESLTEAVAVEEPETESEEPATEECLEEAVDAPADKEWSGVREGSIESLAVDIYNSDEFIDAFVEDGQTFGYAVDEVISNAVIAAYPSFDGDRLDDMINKTRKAIRAHADQEDKDFQLSYSDDFTGDFDRIYKDHFDLAGNAY